MSQKKKQQPATEPIPDVAVYAVGLCAASVCYKNHTLLADVERIANQQEPTGIGSRWQVCKRRKFADGTKNPSPCPDHPNERTHRLLEC